MVRVMRRDECGGDNCPGDTTKHQRQTDIPVAERKMGGVICSNPIHYRKDQASKPPEELLLERLLELNGIDPKDSRGLLAKSTIKFRSSTRERLSLLFKQQESKQDIKEFKKMATARENLIRRLVHSRQLAEQSTGHNISIVLTVEELTAIIHSVVLTPEEAFSQTESVLV